MKAKRTKIHKGSYISRFPFALDHLENDNTKHQYPNQQKVTTRLLQWF